MEGRAIETEECHSVESQVGQNSDTGHVNFGAESGGSFDFVLRVRVEFAVRGTVEHLGAGQQFPQSPIDSLNTFFDFVDTRFSRILQRSVHNL